MTQQRGSLSRGCLKSARCYRRPLPPTTLGHSTIEAVNDHFDTNVEAPQNARQLGQSSRDHRNHTRRTTDLRNTANADRQRYRWHLFRPSHCVAKTGRHATVNAALRSRFRMQLALQCRSVAECKEARAALGRWREPGYREGEKEEVGRIEQPAY